MELANHANGIASKGSSVCSRNATVVVTEVIDIILLSLFLKLCNSLFSVRPSFWCSSGNITGFISEVSSKVHIVLLI
jgi:hypothetical protein